MVRQNARRSAVRCALVADRYGRPWRTRTGILARGWLVRLGLGSGCRDGWGAEQVVAVFQFGEHELGDVGPAG